VVDAVAENLKPFPRGTLYKDIESVKTPVKAA
jgi:hypothetical protein